MSLVPNFSGGIVTRNMNQHKALHQIINGMIVSESAVAI